ncbi:MAG: ATP-binding protein [Microcystaceae cyanobacterium]
MVSLKTSIAQQISQSQSRSLGAELMFIQDKEGRYLEFMWDLAQDYGIQPTEIQYHLAIDGFTPMPYEAYQERLQRILELRIPEACYCHFSYKNQSFCFELVISPILPTQGDPKTVLGMGHLLSDKEIPSTTDRALPVSPDPYQRVLTQVAQKIRKTLNLETIWQHTAESIGKALKLSRCLMVAARGGQVLELKAEYCQSPYPSVVDYHLDPLGEPYWQKGINEREPVIIEQLPSNPFQIQSILLVPTFYKDKRNGLICLQQCDRHRTWTQGELELVLELADQVGTAIAHATLYDELQRTSKAAAEASRLKSEFLASTTHELRTPLNGIIGFLKLILDGMADDAEEQMGFIREAYQSALHLLDIINDILDIAKIEAGKMDLTLDPVELSDLFKAVDNFTRPQAKQKNLYFKIKTPSALTPITLYGNYKRLLQVMLNLVGNAIKFTQEGGIVVNAELVKKAIKWQGQSFPGFVKVSVADTGIGVSLEEQAKLFEKFVQIDGSHTKAHGGTGLGLAISHKLVQAMGGNVEFFSMGEGLGSTVTFTVPLYTLPVVTHTEDDLDLDL